MNLRSTKSTAAHFSRLLLTVAFALFSFEAYCCTSVIISGKVRPDGKPLMLKHRDTGELNNRIQWFGGATYSFIGLVNSSSKGGEVWSGTNSAGFCIMNTATYDLKDDDVPASQMDMEGVVMFKALGICKSVADFEAFLDTLSKPWGVEANFGITDALGGAAYFEVNNHSYVRYDVENEPGGYMVVTNYTRSGRPQDRHGVERFEKASQIMSTLDVATVGHKEIFNQVSRSGDPIMRKITSASIVFEGVAPGEDPGNTVMWTILGCPTTSVYFPLQVFSSDHVPSFMKDQFDGRNSQICSNSLIIKGIYGYAHGCEDECRIVEESIDSRFRLGMSAFAYDRYIRKCYRKYVAMYRRKLPKVSL